MKRKVTSIILIGIMLHSVYACGNIVPEDADHDGIDKPIREELSESGTFQDKEVSEETEDTLSNSEIRQAADVEQIDGIGVYLLYDDAEENCYLYDAPMNMLLRNPEYTGKIGYICEYDPVTVMSKHTHYNADGNVGYRSEYEYISLTGMLCICMTACGNADGQSAAEQSGMEITQEPLEETQASSLELIQETEPGQTSELSSTSEPDSPSEPEEVIDNTQANTEKFYQYAEEACGLSHKEAQSWFDIITEDDIFDGGVREISDLMFDDIDGNGKTDMVIMVEYLYGRGVLYFYMNEEEPYCFTDEDFCFYFPMNICYADLNGDGNVEIALAPQGTGAGAVGDWHKAVFSYTGSTMERLEIPSDLDTDYDDGIKVDVIMETEPDTYIAYCSYFDESITFHASNIYEGDEQQQYLAQAPINVGGNVRGYFGLQIVTWNGRNALQVSEYLHGEGGTGHCVGVADFILVWDGQGNGSVADWWVEEW